MSILKKRKPNSIDSNQQTTNRNGAPGFKRTILAAAILSCTSQAMAQEDKLVLAENDAEVEVIEITGQRQAIESAIDLKRESTTIGDSIVLDEAGKVPSTSLLEILERAPGVTMNRIRAGGEGSPDGFSFEGSGVQVRGLNKTKTLINGHEVFSANGGSGLSWGDIGPELLKTVTVYKASRADLIEGGVAGTVNLETKMPFDHEGFKASAAATVDYGDFSKKVTPAVSGMVSNRFNTDIGEFGILADLAYSKIQSEDSNLITPPYYASDYNGKRVYIPGGIRQSQDQFERTRKGYYAALQWKPSENLEFYHTSFVSQKESNRDSQILSMEHKTIAALDGAEFDDNGVFVRGAISSQNLTSGLAVSLNSSYTPSFSKTSDHVTGFQYEAEDWELGGSFQYNKAESSSGKYSIGSAVTGGNIIQTNMDVSGGRQAVNFNDQVLSTDPADTSLSRFGWLNKANESSNHSAQLDGTYHLDGDFFKQVKVGARISNREESDSFVGTWWSATGRNWNGVPRANVATAPDGDFELEEFSDFFKGDVESVGSIWIGTDQVNRDEQFDRVINTYGACAPDLYYQCSDPETSKYIYGNPADRNLGQIPSFYTTKHDRKSAYVMVGFENDGDSVLTNFSGNFGLRYVKYDVESIGNFSFTNGTRYYANQADANASLEAMGGLENVQAWQAAHEGEQPPYTRESVGYEIDRVGNFSNDYFLPSFNIKFDPSENWVVRYAFTKTLTPPSSPDIRAQGKVSAQGVDNPINEQLDLQYPDDDVSLPNIFRGYTNSSGNPLLEPELGLNHDISIEWYPKKGSSMNLSLFHKTIENYVTFNNFSAPASDFFSEQDQPQSALADGSNGGSVFLAGDVSSRTNFNAEEDTIISGFELGGKTYFDQLDGWMSGFGIDANLTYINNDAPDAFALDINGDKLNVPVIALSEWAYSATLLYDMDKLSARLSYNWRDRYLTTTNDSGTTTTYNDPFTGESIQIGLPVYAAASARLDASVSYKFSDSMNVKLNVQNLTNEDSRTQMEILDGVFVDRAVFVTDRRISLHFGVDF